MKLTQFGCDAEGFLLFFILKCALEVGPVRGKGTSCFLPVRSGLSEAASIQIAASENCALFYVAFPNETTIGASEPWK